MKIARLVVIAGLALALAAPAGAEVDRYDDSQAHPFRLIAYALHPVGYLGEWLVLRPLHRIFAQDDLGPVFGHMPHSGFDFETYTEGLSTGVSYETPYRSIQEPAR